MSARAPETQGFADVDSARLAYVLHDAGPATPIVVMVHGFHGGKTGPSRYFVTLARLLTARGVSAFRFDQPGNGDSSDDFENSSFDNWVANIEHFARGFAADGRRVALLGQSMGGCATIVAAAELGHTIDGIACWSAGIATYDPGDVDPNAWDEEAGERVRMRYWIEAAAIDILACYARLRVPAYMVFGTADARIARDEIDRIVAAAKPADRIRVIDGLEHSVWGNAHRTEIFSETAAFLADALGSHRAEAGS